MSCLKIEPYEKGLSGLLYMHSWLTQPDGRNRSVSPNNANDPALWAVSRALHRWTTGDEVRVLVLPRRIDVIDRVFSNR